jgi:peptidoglycan/LPS O-acetylase OafA/YrhL
VTVFFFISGFLITRLLFAETGKYGKVSLGQFYIRRFLRLMPALFVMLFVTAGIARAMGMRVSGTEFAAGAFYFMNYYNYFLYAAGLERTVTGWGPLWSLAVEEHFYLVFPWLIFLLPRQPRRAASVVAAVLLTCLLLRTAYLPVMADGALYNYYATETRIDSILWGALLTCALQDPSLRRRLACLDHRSALPLAVAGLLLSFLIRPSWFQDTIKYSVQGACLFVLVYRLVMCEDYRILRGSLELPPIRYLGRLSYSLYLWHWHCYAAVVAITGLSGHAAAALALAAAFTVSAASYHFVELQFTRLRKRFRGHPVARARRLPAK